MFGALFKTLNQLPAAPFQRVLWLSVAGSLATAVVLWFVIKGVLDNTSIFDLAWLEWIVDQLGGLAAIVLLILLLPAFIGLVASLMLEWICRAVEARYYPHLPPPRNQSVAEAVMIGIRFAIVLIVFNILALPLYLIPGLNFFVYWGLNSYLLGREYFELVASRRLPHAEISATRRRHGFTTWLAGLVLAVIASIPFVNLLLPIFGTAFMLHTFERINPSIQN